MRFQARSLTRAAVVVGTLGLPPAMGAPAGPEQTTQAADQPGQRQGTLTNADVIKMLKAGLSDALIIETIRRAQSTSFSVTPETLVELKVAGASEALLRVMMNPRAEEHPATGDERRAPAVKLQDGTVIRLVFAEPVSSETAKANDIVRLGVAEDVKVNDEIAIAKGAAAAGHVISAEPRGRLGRGGKLELGLDYAKAVDGSNVRLRGGSKQGDNRAITPAMALGVGSLFIKGKEVAFAKGAAMNAFIDGDKEISTAR